MPRPASNRVRKNYRLNPATLAQAQAALGAATETETIEQALRFVTGDLTSLPVPADRPTAPGTGRSILKLAGTLPARDADAMLEAIEDGCERVDESGW